MRAKLLRNDKGFTLIEMAIVLVIIGLILGAVIKGKDVLNSAKQKKFYNNSIKEWELTLASYFDRTGNMLGDGTDNAGTAATANGRFDSQYIYGNLDDQIRKIGLTVPTSTGPTSGQYLFTGAYSGPTTVNFYLQNYTSTSTATGASGNNNILRFISLPVDLAIALDTIIDGSISPDSGSFRIYPDSNTEWPNASTTTVQQAYYIIDLP
ncbi:type II secretion system protein [Desulforhopalus sp. 52FAK]